MGTNKAQSCYSLRAFDGAALLDLLGGVGGHEGGQDQGRPEADLLLLDDVSDAKIPPGNHGGEASSGFSGESLSILDHWS